MVITWKNIAAPSFSDGNNLVQANQTAVGDGFRALGSSITQLDNLNQEQNTNTLLEALQGAGSQEELARLQATGNFDVGSLQGRNVDVTKVLNALRSRGTQIHEDKLGAINRGIDMKNALFKERTQDTVLGNKQANLDVATYNADLGMDNAIRQQELALGQHQDQMANYGINQVRRQEERRGIKESADTRAEADRQEGIQRTLLNITDPMQRAGFIQAYKEKYPDYDPSFVKGLQDNTITLAEDNFLNKAYDPSEDLETIEKSDASPDKKAASRLALSQYQGLSKGEVFDLKLAENNTKIEQLEAFNKDPNNAIFSKESNITGVEAARKYIKDNDDKIEGFIWGADDDEIMAVINDPERFGMPKGQPLPGNVVEYAMASVGDFSDGNAESELEEALARGVNYYKYGKNTQPEINRLKLENTKIERRRNQGKKVSTKSLREALGQSTN